MADDTLDSARERADLVLLRERIARARRAEIKRNVGAGFVIGATSGDGVPAAYAIDAAKKALTRPNSSFGERLAVAEAQAAVEKQQAAERADIRKHDYDTLVATHAANDKVIAAMQAVATKAQEGVTSLQSKQIDSRLARATELEKRIAESPVSRVLNDPERELAGRAEALSRYIDGQIRSAGPGDPAYASRMVATINTDPDAFWGSVGASLKGLSPVERAAVMRQVDARLAKDPDGRGFFERLGAGEVMGPDGVAVQGILPPPGFNNIVDPEMPAPTEIMASFSSGGRELDKSTADIMALQEEGTALYEEMSRIGVPGIERSLDTLAASLTKYGLFGATPPGTSTGTGEGGADGGPVSAPLTSEAARMLTDLDAQLAAGDQDAAEMKAAMLADPTFQSWMLKDGYSSPEGYYKALGREARSLGTARTRQDARTMRTGQAPATPLPPALTLPEEQVARGQAAPPAAPTTLAAAPEEASGTPTTPREEEAALLSAEEATRLARLEQGDRDEGSARTNEILARVAKQITSRKYGRLGRAGR